MALVLSRKIMLLLFLCLSSFSLSAQFNTIEDSVRLFTAADPSWPLPFAASLYPPGSLQKITSTNEWGAQVVEFRKADGQIVLRKEQYLATPATGHAGWLCTYYIYDDRGLLVAVSSPQMFFYLTGVWIVQQPSVPFFIFYRYDDKNRLVMEKQMDTDSVEYVYDRNDRIVISFDGELKKFLMSRYFQYDSLNRITTMGIGYAYPLRTTMQTIMDTTTQELPFLPESARIPQVRNYYDDYGYAGKMDYQTADIHRTRAGSNAHVETPPDTPDSATAGRVTGRSLYVMATGQWLLTTTYYDYKGRVIQTLADNFTGGKDIINYLYDTSGHLLSTYQRHTNPLSTLTPETTVLTMFHYDSNGRVDAVEKMVNDDESQLRTIAVNTYDVAGNIINKRLDVHDNTQLESLDYDFTSGRLSGINNTYVTTDGSMANWFGQEIDSTAGIKWKTRSDGITRAYAYTYNMNGRLIAANYTRKDGMGWTQDAEDYSAGMSYDLNGNLITMRQRGMNGIVKKTIDSLEYGYTSSTYNSDRMSYVTDRTNDAQSVLGDFHEQVNNVSIDYAYDRSGNMISDKNRDIYNMLYDFNGQPTRYVITDGGTLDYIYDALGNKLGKVEFDQSVLPAVYKVERYAGGFVYREDTLRYIEQEEGRIRAVYTAGHPVQYVYDYYVKDDKGNTRVVLSTEKDTSVYAATMETAASGVENALFANIDNTRAAKPGGYPVDNTTDPNTYVALLNGSSGQKIGPSLVLRVMAGDSVKMGVKAYYQSSDANTSDNTPEAMVASLLSVLNGSIVAEGVHQATGAGSPVNSVFNGMLYNNLTNMDPDQNEPLQPKAYLNYVLFDDQFNMVSENSGVRQVQGDANTLLTLTVAEQQLKRSGFLYIYTSNESAADVYFDNLIVTHTSGPLLEETHYYPLGLTMAGLSNQALKGAAYPKNRVKLLGKTFDETKFRNGRSVELYHFNTRLYDPQTGRFHAPEPRGVSTPYGF